MEDKIKDFEAITLMELMDNKEYKQNSFYISTLIKAIKGVGHADIMSYKPFKDKELDWKLQMGILDLQNILSDLESLYEAKKSGVDIKDFI